MSTALDLAGVRFGRLVALRRVGTAPNGKSLWLCRCDCGTEATTRVGHLKSGLIRSCGCLQRETRILNGKASRHAVVSYRGAHQRTVSTRDGAPEHMCPCGAPAREWAYNHADPDERTEMRTGKGSTWLLAYSMDPQYYVAMCIPCHSQMDATFGREEPDE